MLKNFVLRYSHIILTVALFVGNISANLACRGNFYQPKVPQQLLKR